MNTNKTIKYTAVGIVSKKNINSNTDSSALFPFDKSQKLSDNTVFFSALLRIIDNQAVMIIEYQLYYSNVEILSLSCKMFYIL
ncbi:MAG: hypothetical protein ACTTJH_01305 [Bacteroidales bacterium]